MTATALDYTRQRAWFDPEKTNASATIVGCGGIGSFTAFALAKLGVQQLTLCDFDVVEDHNIPNQLFTADYVGSNKAYAVAAQLDGHAGTDLRIIRERFANQTSLLSDVVIAAVDSMEARAELWMSIRLKPRVGLFLDGRLSGQKIVLYAVNPMKLADVKGYEATLYSDADAEEDSCTAKSIIDVGFAIASLITNAVRKHYADEQPTPMTYLNMATLDLLKGDWLDD